VNRTKKKNKEKRMKGDREGGTLSRCLCGKLGGKGGEIGAREEASTSIKGMLKGGEGNGGNLFSNFRRLYRSKRGREKASHNKKGERP